MGNILLLYLANISNRFRELAINVFRLTLLALVVEYLLLSPHQKPSYYSLLYSIIDKTWLVFLLCFILVLLPSESYIINVLALKRRNRFLRENIFVKLLRLIKYKLKYDILGLPYQDSIYKRLISSKRIKYVYILLYLWDIYKGYSRIIRDIISCVIAYFGFAFATWLYVRYTGTNVYYINLIDHSFAWGIAVIGFLFFKIILLPNWKTMRSIGLYILSQVLAHQLGLNKAESILDEKLDKYNRLTKRG